MDKKIEVDPRLFITCRLCLDELGIYQIVPAVKEQISYCFDIHVEPFDGLPQLICKKCEAILNSYDAIKKTFVAKQNDLIKKIKGCVNEKSPEDQVKTISPVKALNESHESKSDFPSRPNLSKKRRHISSSSSSSNNSNTETKVTKKDGSDEKIDHNDPPDRDDSWEKIYRKMFVCRVCSMQWSSAKAVLGHFNSRHYTIRKRNKTIFRQHCKVMLYRFDDTPNITGSHRNVVLDMNKIIESVHSKFYVMYTIKDSHVKPSSRSSWNGNNECSDFSEDDLVVKQRKKRRLHSASSNETVVLEGSDSNSLLDTKKESQKAKPTVVSECINIDDSSESEMEGDENKTNYTSKHDSLPETDVTVKVDLDAINEIITGCKNKYTKKRFNNDIMQKVNLNPAEVANLLKRKVLSIGRKVINNKSSNHRIMYCTPLLRFMEYKNLDVAWQSRSVNCDNVDSNFIRIITRVKDLGENNLNEPGWTDYDDALLNDPFYRESVIRLTNLNKDNNVVDGAEKEMNGIVPPSVTVTLTPNDNTHLTDTKKLLNANPVANPKQLPKKFVNTETKAASKIHAPLESTTLEVSQNDNNIEMCLPIITSTTSLAPSVLLADSNKNENNSPTVEPPRIKVKSVTELMSKETLSRMQEPEDPMPCIVSSAVSLQKFQIHTQNDNNSSLCITSKANIVPQYQYSQAPVKNYNTVENVTQQESPNKTNCVILDTFEFPNTTTTSPFDYFRKLLRVHNIALLDLDVNPSPEFYCLLKFKVLFQQEPNKSVPVVLSLSLACSKNTFILTIKDRNQENINISKISANWQWEVLKVYRGSEVIGRILNNAQKVNPEVFDFTNSFLCLLKSINYIKAV